ncbi:MAG: hypothetical protein ACRDC4_12245 [Plesiomonas sp.]
MAYGIEIISPEGNKFTIPDSNPYVFYRRIDVSNTQGLVDTGIPANVLVMVFNRLEEGAVLIVGGANHLVHNGTWHLYVTSIFFPITVQFYIFTNKELVNGPTTAYGFQVFDAEGGLVVSNNSRPLKMNLVNFVEPTDPNNPVMNIGYPAATTASITRCYNGSSVGGSITYGYAMGAIGAGNGYTTHSKEIGFPNQWIPYPSTNYPQYILVIDIRNYQ